MPTRARGANRVFAFGVEPSTTRYRLRLARYQAVAEAIADYIRRSTPQGTLRLLDVGVGNGRTLRYLEPLGVADRVSFHGIDLSPRRLAHLYKPERWKLVQGNVEQGLPYGTGQFDIVVCEQVLEHLTRPADVLKEIGRVLKPDGLLVVGVPVFPPVLSQVRRHLVPPLDRLTGRDRGHAQVFSMWSFVRQVRRAGCFKVTGVRGFRIVSDGIFSPLENFKSWWLLNRGVGRVVPWLCVEIQVLATRRAAETDGAPGTP